ncbi:MULTISPECIES: hypothetical protein [Rhodococcus]|uniref:hypothetical protein n=1 Tax=Rhodococcus TaxID=1827 RepID=UPI001D141DFF|nr:MULTISPECIES: hypothetical protein [Rhodococcus]WMM72281.1 hypothetical protein RCF27_20985 [Rhodococcus pyridinivorans]BDB62773.1 hypothetical protein RDE2_45670 [Rhodococcus sp. RDE2]
MPPKGGRANFASLVGAVGDNSPVDRKRTPHPQRRRRRSSLSKANCSTMFRSISSSPTPATREPEAPQPKEPASKLEPVDKVAQALKRLGADPDVLAAAVRKHFTDDEGRKIIDALELR